MSACVEEREETLMVPAHDGIDFLDISKLREIAVMYRKEQESLKEMREISALLSRHEEGE